MAKEKKKEEGMGGSSLAIAAVIILLVLAGAYYLSMGKQAPQIAPSPPPTQSAEASRMLLASFDAEAAASDYDFAYTNSEDGAKTYYTLMKNGSNSYVKVQGDFGSLEGFFGKDNSTDVVCLYYVGKTQCATAGNRTDIQGIADSLRILRPSAKTSQEQKQQTRKLIEVGAIRFEGEPVGEKVGSFDTKKISYSLDYKNLTVQTLVAIGVSPNDPNIYNIGNWMVSRWVDVDSGIAVKSYTSYKENLIPHTFGREYAVARASAASITAKPGAMVSPEAFVQFYAQSEQDYGQKLSCLAIKEQKGRDSCLKGLAHSIQNADMCKLISDKAEMERCVLIVAQVKGEAKLCSSLVLYADDCYIAVAGENGDFELCKLLKDRSLLTTCTDAAAEGKKKADALEAELRRTTATQCKSASDCRKAGSTSQYCVSKNDQRQFADDNSSAAQCRRGLPCGCVGGYCDFEKNESYYACLSDVETQYFKTYLNSLSQNSTNSTNTTWQQQN